MKFSWLCQDHYWQNSSASLRVDGSTIAEMMPEPTADGEPVPATMKVPAERTEPSIAPEPKSLSDQVCESATSCVAVEFIVE